MNYRFFYAISVLYFCLICYAIECVSPYLLQIPASEFRLIRQFESSHSYIAIVKHKKTLYIVKQKKYKHSIRKSITQAILADVLAFSTKQIVSQRVWVIPKNKKFPGKKYDDEPASLHTIVPGMSVYNWRHSLKRIRLRRVEELLSDFSIKLDRYQGIDIGVIGNMTKHNDLPPIVALHLITGFYDCHNKNIFYDYNINRFSIIDMDSCYRSNLTGPSYAALSKILLRYRMNKKYVPSHKLRNALLSFADTIELIIKKNPIETVRTILLELYDLLKVTDNPVEQKKFLRSISRIEPFLLRSYSQGKKIVSLIRSTLLNRGKNPEHDVIPPRYCTTNLYNLAFE